MTYIEVMNDAANAARPSLRQLGGLRGLLRNPGLILHTWRRGGLVGKDAQGNQFFETRVAGAGRPRRWVVYAGVPEASSVGPEWYGWLRYETAAPLPAGDRRPWQLPHQPNLTGTAAGYRPAGHDYQGGVRARNSADYEAWTPEA